MGDMSTIGTPPHITTIKPVINPLNSLAHMYHKAHQVAGALTAMGKPSYVVSGGQTLYRVPKILAEWSGP